MYEPGSAISSSGALTAYSGKKTGRSPLDKRIVEEPGSQNDIWWGPVNKPMSTDVRFPSCGLSHLFFSLFWHHIHHSGSFTAWSHDRATAGHEPLACGHEPHGKWWLLQNSSGSDCPLCTNQPDVIGDHRLHKAYPLFSLESLNCGCWMQMLLNATLEGRLVPHMPLVTEIIGVTPRPSSCTPLIPQPKAVSTSAWRFLSFPPSYPDSREYGNTHETNT